MQFYTLSEPKIIANDVIYNKSDSDITGNHILNGETSL